MTQIWNKHPSNTHNYVLVCYQRDKDYCELQTMERTPEFTRGVLFIVCNSLEDKR